MVVVTLHTQPHRVSSTAPLEGADAVLTVFSDGAMQIEGDGSLIDFTVPVRCALTRRVVDVWQDAERWARGLPCHAHYRSRDLLATLVADVCVPDTAPSAMPGI
jgi:hypothetical protein